MIIVIPAPQHPTISTEYRLNQNQTLQLYKNVPSYLQLIGHDSTLIQRDRIRKGEGMIDWSHLYCSNRKL